MITYRRGDTPVPDASWTTFATVPSTGTISGSSRYVQFAIQISSSSPGKSPVIQDVTVQFQTIEASFSSVSFVVSGFSRTLAGPPEGGHYENLKGAWIA